MNIPQLLEEEHHKIETLLTEFKSSTNQERWSNLEKLKWTVQKHLFLEEKAIFTSMKQNAFPDLVPRLLSEHNLLIKLLERMESNVLDEKPINLMAFENFLKEHESFEELTFYPHLEQELNSLQKRLLMEKISINVR